MSAVNRFFAIAQQEQFKGWPLVGEPELGAKIPFFGQALNYRLQTGNGVEDYTSIIRHFGWVVVFGVVQHDGVPQVITLVQWKPGVNCASWELPPGGIGKIAPDASLDEIEQKTRETFLRETGYGGGDFEHLGHVMIETGKFRGAGPDDHGLPAHLYLATGLQQMQAARSPNPNEIMETLLVPLEEFPQVLASDYFTETSAVACAFKALHTLGMFGVQMPTHRALVSGG
jgi:hypothetical protein